MLIPFQRQLHFLSLSCIKQNHTLNCTLSAVIVETAAEDWVWVRCCINCKSAFRWPLGPLSLPTHLQLLSPSAGPSAGLCPRPAHLQPLGPPAQASGGPCLPAHLKPLGPRESASAGPCPSLLISSGPARPRTSARPPWGLPGVQGALPQRLSPPGKAGMRVSPGKGWRASHPGQG